MIVPYLIDTDIIIHSLRGHDGVRKHLLANANIPKYVSVISYGELVYGARKSKHPEKNLATTRRIAELFPLLEITPAVMESFGEIKARLEKGGNRLDDMDLLIAATALTRNLVLITGNAKHFQRIHDLQTEDWTKQ